MIRLLALALLIHVPLIAQGTTNNYSFHLDNGATVLYQTYSEGMPNFKDWQETFGTASASGNVIRRTMLDRDRKPWLAFEVHIERKPGAGPIHFLLSMEPLGGAAFFGEKAAPREIENGDRILMDVLEEPGTGRKIFDTFQVGVGVPMQIMPLARSVPQIPKQGTVIHLQNPQFLKRTDVYARAAAEISGAKIAISVPDRGRFLFSTQPEQGFRMEAIAERDHIRFIVGNDLLVVQCSAPIVEGGGPVYLWVKREPLEGRPAVPNLDLSIH